MPTEQTNIKVVVRVRPYNRRELEQNQRCIIKVMDKSTLLFDPDEEDDEFFFQGTKQNYRDITKRVNKKLSMEFDRVYEIDVPNKHIFEECTAPLVDSVLNGYNCSVFVYGATGAGKTFTMLGNDNCPGLTFLTMSDLFEKIQLQSGMRKFDVGVSYLEVYNEQVMNLLTKTGPLKLREDSNGVVVSGLVLKPIYSAEELLELLTLGNSNRTQHPTDANAESSRSHAVFQVHIRITDIKTGTKRTVKLSMIDLAGSERAASTKGLGIRFKEGASINKSLLALGNCINKLADGLKHIPYRDSNLTRILKDSLGGNCQTLMVANVSMSSLTYEDTYNTLKYASRAKKIRTTLRQNALKSNMPKDFYIKKVTELMLENERLKETNKKLETMVEGLEKSPRGCDENELRRWHSKIDDVYSSVLKTKEYVVGIKSKVMFLNLQLKLLNNAECKRKLLVLDEDIKKEDIIKLRLKRNSIQKQIDQQKEELPRCEKKLHYAKKNLEKLKREVKESNCDDILKNYLVGKDLEVRNASAHNKFNHQSEINRVLLNNSNSLIKDIYTACELLQESYETLDIESKLTTTLRTNFEKLEQRLRPKENISTTDEGIECSHQTTMIMLNGKRLESIDNGKQQIAKSTKKPINIGGSDCTQMREQSWQLYFEDIDIGLESIEETDSEGYEESESDYGKMVKKPRTLNETQILTAHHKIDDPNSTYNLYKTNLTKNLKSNIMLEKKNYVANVLSEQISRLPPNTDQLKNVLLKSMNFTRQGLLRTVAAGVQKENKKKNSPITAHKSQHKIIIKSNNIEGHSSHLLTKSTRQLAITNRLEPQVRINRAASLRVRK